MRTALPIPPPSPRPGPGRSPRSRPSAGRPAAAPGSPITTSPSTGPASAPARPMDSAWIGRRTTSQVPENQASERAAPLRPGRQARATGVDGQVGDEEQGSDGDERPAQPGGRRRLGDRSLDRPLGHRREELRSHPGHSQGDRRDEQGPDHPAVEPTDARQERTEAERMLGAGLGEHGSREGRPEEECDHQCGEHAARDGLPLADSPPERAPGRGATTPRGRWPGARRAARGRAGPRGTARRAAWPAPPGWR